MELIGQAQEYRLRMRAKTSGPGTA
jgi:hypothetical protein